MTFNEACPSGNIMVELSNGEAPSAGYECIECGTENPDHHICKFCLDEIDVKVCEEHGGSCRECRDANDYADKFGV